MLTRLLVIIALSFASVSTAQEIEPPKNAERYFVTVFTHSNPSPEGQRLLDNLQAEPMGSELRKLHVNHYTEKSALYKAGRWEIANEANFPILMFQRPDGGVLFYAAKGSIPASSHAIYGELKKVYDIEKALQSSPEVVLTQEIEGPILDRWRDDKPVEGLFGGDTPVRDTMASTAWVVAGVVLLVFLLPIAFLAAVFGVTFLYLFIKLVKNLFSKD